jgi:hypothetical protein
MIDLNDFKKETECIYKKERYSVRDNGAVYRHARDGKPLRIHDKQWTFGKPNIEGYFEIASVRVHRIVAVAFLGEPPSNQHVVDHIDTNRQNNRPENLRWLTKLENILNNPITIKRIEFHCGSIEAFLENPSILKKHEHEYKNFSWMRSVTSQEAKSSWERLSQWANKKGNNPNPTKEPLGEWIYTPFNENNIVSYVESLTPNAKQVDWKTPTAFPLCPEKSSNNPIASYYEKLKVGYIFSQYKHISSIIEEFAISKDEKTLWVININSDGIKRYSLAEVTYVNDFYIHKSLGSYFKKDGAEKQFILAQGFEWTGGETYDELCG